MAFFFIIFTWLDRQICGKEEDGIKFQGPGLNLSCPKHNCNPKTQSVSKSSIWGASKWVVILVYGHQLFIVHLVYFFFYSKFWLDLGSVKKKKKAQKRIVTWFTMLRWTAVNRKYEKESVHKIGREWKWFIHSKESFKKTDSFMTDWYRPRCFQHYKLSEFFPLNCVSVNPEPLWGELEINGEFITVTPHA